MVHFLPQDNESSSAGSSQSSPFDTPLNEALNVMKNKDKLSKPTSCGRQRLVHKMVVILYRWWAKGEKDQLGKLVA